MEGRKNSGKWFMKEKVSGRLIIADLDVGNKSTGGVLPHASRRGARPRQAAQIEAAIVRWISWPASQRCLRTAFAGKPSSTHPIVQVRRPAPALTPR